MNGKTIEERMLEDLPPGMLPDGTMNVVDPDEPPPQPSEEQLPESFGPFR
jgi:hypothetical protein